MSSYAAAYDDGIARVTSLKILGVTFTDTLSVAVHVDDVINSSVCPCTPFASCSLTRCRCLLCNRCSVLLSSRSSPVPIRLGGPLPNPLTASVLTPFFVARTNQDSGHPLCHLTFLLLRICAQQPTTNFLLKLLHSRTTYYMHFCHRITQTAYTLLSAPWTLHPSF